MKHRGASIIFSNNDRNVLLLLRDDKPSIPYPGMWDLPGGHIEAGETPHHCIQREMKEELLVDTGACDLFCIYDFDDRIEYVYTRDVFFRPEDIDLQEGQELRWFSLEEIRTTGLAYGFNQVLEDYFARR
ncbi:NUDIX hydrolase [Prosthecochloris sp. N3]|uniref:NUDIX hydrolase n=1 Tax=Prosthecochloris ethylica TaxID=2743976 RepID=A0ABR9XPX7_9CHLB|nr:MULTISPECIES: NUDIX hydrolase [Prosthecochloris]MBF0586139.1 NUDIX hydrolase [Prosthecochloris ethylica]MBF0635845.1 NUDIX hydrolase [Prosthecochloris ethylica]NUK47479.1 NUDIX hydrolase [Prosthecochloris ethylica]RNA65024.1 NUDIX domain-containing protein [Prosthecochloris sp. ZM_2]